MRETIREFMSEVMSCYENDKAMNYAKNPLAKKIKSGFPRCFGKPSFPEGSTIQCAAGPGGETG